MKSYIKIGYFLTTNANTMGVTAIILSIIQELSLEGKVSDTNLLVRTC